MTRRLMTNAFFTAVLMFYRFHMMCVNPVSNLRIVTEQLPLNS
jgi:hypothetical protein